MGIRAARAIVAASYSAGLTVSTRVVSVACKRLQNGYRTHDEVSRDAEVPEE